LHQTSQSLNTLCSFQGSENDVSHICYVSKHAVQKEDCILIKNLYLLKAHTAEKLLKDFLVRVGMKLEVGSSEAAKITSR